MRQENQARPEAIEHVAAVLGDRWKVLILREAFFGVRRYGELVRNLGIARNILASKLKELVADGVLERRRYRTNPDWFEYVLSPSGLDLYGAILAALHWAEVHGDTAGGPELHVRHRLCGEPTHAKVVCSACGEELHAHDVEAAVS
ncbi:MAG: helix-turn-helix transcriptional regulator [Actinomycetota bacterium]|nr:helix-turn-helix transcriptional regulator [Actinomycetota bacterium]